MKRARSLLIIGCFLFWSLVIGVLVARADFLTFDCTPPGDEITGARVQIDAAAPVGTPLVSTCGEDPATKVTCTDPKSKTICFPAPPGAFTAKALVYNIRADSAFSPPLNVPAAPSSPSLLKIVR